MSIKAELAEPSVKTKPTFPLLRQHIGWGSGPDNESTQKYGTLVVVFHAEQRGVALAGVEPGRIGVTETWHSCFDQDTWTPCSVTLTSEG